MPARILKAKPARRLRVPLPRPRRGARHTRALAAVVGEPARFVPPMKALSVDRVPKGRWRLEVKLDGYRAVAAINNGVVEMWSRNHKVLTADYPELVEVLKALPCTNATIDGEIVALDAEGRSRFQLLQGRDLPGSRPRIVYYVFDLV